ncbi:MAG TPA: metal-dependent phosphohydrolase [Planctomycetes bacterium]|nr:metal-dependent phosphohydrolase [Planctomycetota bacterium]
MRAAARRYGRGEEDERAFALAGLLHDADYDRWPEEHPNRIVAWLRERGEEEIAHAVSAHYTRWGVPHESTLDKALLACDELTGFVGACCLVRPDGIASLGPKSVKKKLKDKKFAAKVDREEVRIGAELLGVDLGEHIAFVIEALRPHAEELGLEGRGSSD